ncbi:MAG: hypothetical protein ACOYON_01485 [Fimbriimonas sp.]
MRWLVAGLLLASVPAPAQPFGRFGYKALDQFGGFELSAEGFRAQNPLADWVRFWRKSPYWTPIKTTAMEQVIQLDQTAMMPSKLRASLTGLGVEMFCPTGLGLRLRSTAAPYLTWPEGSVADGVETPNCPWIAISFRDRQPAILVGFLGAPTSLKVKGRPGDWTIQTPADYEGWIRVCLPRGIGSARTTNAADLGQLSKEIQAQTSLWTQPTASLAGTDLSQTAEGLQVDLNFDGPGARVPTYLLLAPLAGYRVKILSPIRSLPVLDPEGPVAISERATLSVLLVDPTLDEGRGIAYEGEVGNTSLPMRFLTARTPVPSRDAERRFATSLASLKTEVEPLTKSRLPFARSGVGMVAAAQTGWLAFLLARSGKVADYSLTDSVGWRWDWLSGRLGADSVTDGKALEALSHANVISATADRPWLIFAEASLAGIKGRAIWQGTKGLAPVPEFPALIPTFRRALYTGNRPDVGYGVTDPWATWIRSPYRVRIGSATAKRLPDGSSILVVEGTVSDDNRFVAELKFPLGVVPSLVPSGTTGTIALLPDGWWRLEYTRILPVSAQVALTIPPGSPAIPSPPQGQSDPLAEGLG